MDRDESSAEQTSPEDSPDDAQASRQEAAVDDQSAESDHIAGERPDDDAMPASPVRRRLRTMAALIFIGLILTFLVWFIATNTEQY